MARGYFCGGGFSGVDCDDATAAEEDILEGRTAGISGKDDLVQGRMPERGDWGSTELAAGVSIIIPGGHHSGKGKVTAKSLASQTPGNLAANKMLAGTYGWSGGRRFDGEIASQGPITLKPGTTPKTGSVIGKYMTGNITVPAISIPASAIKKGHKITFPDGSSVTGTFEGWVPTPQDLYYNGVNIAGFYLHNNSDSYAVFENTQIRITSQYIGNTSLVTPAVLKFVFPKAYDVRSYSKLIIEGTLTGYDSKTGHFGIRGSNSINDMSSVEWNGTVNSVTINIAQLTSIPKDCLLCSEKIKVGSVIKRIRLA